MEPAPVSPPDHGPVYAETDLAAFPVDAYATWANLVFLAVLVYWAWRTRCRFSAHPLIVGGLPLLAVGWVGGTTYHATRSHSIWLVLDFAPIFMLVLLATVYLWRQVTGSWLWTAVLGAGPVVVYREIALAGTLPPEWFVTLGYAMLGGNLVIPAAWHCATRNRAAAGWLAAAIAAFALALCFRQSDLALAGSPGFPRGTHYLWHLFGGAATHMMLAYFWRERAGARVEA